MCKSIIFSIVFSKKEVRLIGVYASGMSAMLFTQFEYVILEDFTENLLQTI